MAPVFEKPIQQLPLIPPDLKKHRVHEPLDTRFRSAARSRSNIPRSASAEERNARIFKSATASDADAAHSFSIHYQERRI
jgi:hypothetical protein